MRVISNTRLIYRNRKVGQAVTLTSLAILGLGLYASIAMQGQWYLSFGALIIGFMLSQIGIYYGTRWGRSPRPDERLSAALKGLDDKYALYHYATPFSHLLVGPAGVLALLPYHQKGTISYNTARQRWQQKGGSLYWKIFGQEGLGRPDLEVKETTTNLEKFIKSGFPEADSMPLDAVMVFINDEVELITDEAPTPAVKLEKLKDYIRRRAREMPASLEAAQALQQKLPQGDII